MKSRETVFVKLDSREECQIRGRGIPIYHPETRNNTLASRSLCWRLRLINLSHMTGEKRADRTRV